MQLISENSIAIRIKNENTKEDNRILRTEIFINAIFRHFDNGGHVRHAAQ